MKLLLILTVLSGILSGEYNAQILSVAEQDSILNVRSDNVQCTRYRLEKENEEKIYRHSYVADWYIVDTMRNNRRKLGEGIQNTEYRVQTGLHRVRDAQMSPNGRYVAFAIDNNLYIHKCDFGTEVAVTRDEAPDIINGIADWLYEEEFGTTALFAWSPDSKQLAYVRLDEREVPAFSWDEWISGLGDERYPQYPTQKSLRYPKAGCNNAKASVWVYDVGTKGIQRLEIGDRRLEIGDFYIPRIRWTDENTVMVLRVNRDQTKMEVLSCNAKSTVSHPWYKEESKKYFVDYSLFDQWQWLRDGRAVILSEEDGWRRAYLYSREGMKVKALTPKGTDVTALYAVDEATQTLYYQAAPTPATRQIYAVSVESRKSKVESPIQLTSEEGMHSARFSADGTKAIICYQSFDTPNRYTLWKFKGLKGSKVETLLDNAEVKEAWAANKLPEPEMMELEIGDLRLEGMLLIDRCAQREKTASLKDKSPLVVKEQRPLVVMHYSGPASQRVLNRWRKKFEYALVEAGYAVLIVDPRGSDCKGRAWRNETYMSMGQKEAEDLIAAAKTIGQREDIDAERMAIIGWSYGGYETLYTMSMKDHPFKAGVAIAPVTDWRLYDSAYTERYMRRPQVNDRGYNEASLLPRAKDLTGNVLIIHGTGDDNVHVQHTMQYINALVEADKQFEMQLYPDDNHHLRKGKNAEHLHKKIINFLQKNL